LNPKRDSLVSQRRRSTIRDAPSGRVSLPEPDDLEPVGRRVVVDVQHRAVRLGGDAPDEPHVLARLRDHDANTIALVSPDIREAGPRHGNSTYRVVKNRRPPCDRGLADTRRVTAAARSLIHLPALSGSS